MSWYDIVPKWVLGEKEETSQMQPIAYTGDGGDGMVQPRKPVEMVQSKQGPVMLHEGEGKIQNSDGSITVVPQQKLQQMEAITGMRGMADGGTYDPANQLQPITNPTPSSSDYFNQGMKAIADTASGNSPALKNMENTATQNFTGSALASSGAAKQSGAQAGYDMKAIANVEQRNARNLEGERSTLMNTIAQTKQNAATTAQQQLVSGGLQGRSQGLQETQYQDTKKQADWDRMLLYYDPSTPEGLSQLQSAYTQMFGGTTPDFNVLKEQRDYAQKKQQQDIRSGNLMISAQDLQNISTQLGINTATSQAIAEAINTGATKDYIQQRFGITLSDDQFNSLSQSYGQKIQLGTLSINAQDLANTASKLGIDTQKMQNAITAINSGATKSYLQSALGISLTDAEYNGLKEQYLQKVQIGNLTITSQDLANTASQLGIDVTKSQAIINAINSGATKDLVQQQFGVTLTDAQFSSMQKKYFQSITAGDYELEQLKTTVGDQKFNSVVQRITAGASLSSINNELGTSLTNAEYDQMYEASEAYFRKQGLSMEQATLYGYKDENGNHVKGQMEIAQESLGLQSETLDMQREELKKKYDLLTAEDKRAADGFYGYDVKNASGNVIGRVMGSLELATKSYDLQKQGLDLETAQIKGYIDPSTGNFIKGSVQLNAEKQGMEVSSLYGYYYDPKTGQVVTDSSEIARRGDELERVDGSLSLAAKTFGLQSKTYEDQRLEMFGGTDPKTGKTVTGKMDLLSNEDQRSAHQLYGYDEQIEVMDNRTGRYTTKTVHHAGTLELQADEMAIKKQGLTLDEAKLYGYEKDGKHISGALEIESNKLNLLEEEYNNQQVSTQGTALAAHFALMSNTSGYDYENDKQAKKLLQDYWTATTGDTGPYDPEWADRQFQASTISQIDASISKLEGESWFKAKKPEQQEEIRKLVGFAAMMSVTQGLQPVYDEKGEIVELKDGGGDSVWKLAGYATDNKITLSSLGVTDKKAGETFVIKDTTYKVNSDGATVTVQATPEESQAKYADIVSSINTEIGSKITQTMWENMGSPGSATLVDWYNNKGGKYFIGMANTVGTGDLGTATKAIFAKGGGDIKSIDMKAVEKSFFGDADKQTQKQIVAWINESVPNFGGYNAATNGAYFSPTGEPITYESLINKESSDLKVSYPYHSDSDRREIAKKSVNERLKTLGYSEDQIASMNETQILAKVAPQKAIDKLSSMGYSDDQIAGLNAIRNDYKMWTALMKTSNTEV